MIPEVGCYCVVMISSPRPPKCVVQAWWANFHTMMPSLSLILLASLTAARDASISLDTSTLLGDLPPIARFFGADEPNYAYSPDGEALLSELGALGPHQTYFRTHNLLTTCDPIDDVAARLKWGCTNAYTEDASGNPIYNWTIIDRILIRTWSEA